MRLAFTIAVACLTTAGCVTMDAADCRSANWYDIGYRDGLFGMQRMDVAYDEQCSKQGAKPDLLAYSKGWQEGLWEFDARKAHGGEE
jgi:hypothetical protein